MDNKQPIEVIGGIGAEDTRTVFMDDVHYAVETHFPEKSCSFILRVKESAFPRMTFGSFCTI